MSDPIRDNIWFPLVDVYQLQDFKAYKTVTDMSSIR